MGEDAAVSRGDGGEERDAHMLRSNRQGTFRSGSSGVGSASALAPPYAMRHRVSSLQPFPSDTASLGLSSASASQHDHDQPAAQHSVHNQHSMHSHHSQHDQAHGMRHEPRAPRRVVVMERESSQQSQLGLLGGGDQSSEYSVGSLDDGGDPVSRVRVNE